MSRFQINRLIAGGVITNYFCPSSCAHCLYNCGPHWPREYLSQVRARILFEKVRSMGCRSVHIGGGEPLLRPRALGAVLSAARRARMVIEYVETNAAWYKDPESARTLLSSLRHQGLRNLLISISPFHNGHIPYRKTQGAMRAAYEAGINVFPWIDDFCEDLSAFDSTRPHSLDEYEKRFGKHYLLEVLQRYWIHMGGRALETFRPLFPQRGPEEILAEDGGDCSGDLLSTRHFHVDLFGNYIPGLCSGLAIAVEDLGTVLTPAKYPLLSALFEQGIAGLMEIARDFGYVPQRPGYLNKCDLCTEMRRYLSQKDGGWFRELNPREFYRDGVIVTEA